MSGVRNKKGRSGRISEVEECAVQIRGVGKVLDGVVMKGVNDDGMGELFVEAMDQNLVLLSEKQYAKEGAVVLL